MVSSFNLKNVIIETDKVSLNEFFDFCFTHFHSLLVAVNHILHQNVCKVLKLFDCVNTGFFYQYLPFLLLLTQCIPGIHLNWQVLAFERVLWKQVCQIGFENKWSQKLTFLFPLIIDLALNRFNFNPEI